MIPMMPVQPSEIKAIEFLKRSDSTFSGACVVELGSFESLKKAIEIDGREIKGMVIWAVKDEGQLIINKKYKIMTHFRWYPDNEFTSKSRP